MQKFQDVVLNSNGQPVSGASILVRPTGGTSTSVLYGDLQGTATVSNPRTTDAVGAFGFYAPNGRYDLVISGSYFATTTRTDIMTEDVPLTNLQELTTASTARTALGLGPNSTATGAFQGTSTYLTNLSTAAYATGDLITFDGTGLVRIPTTASGQVVTSQGTGAVPKYAAAAGGGDVLAANNLSEFSTGTKPAASRANILAQGTDAAIAITTNTQSFSKGQRGLFVSFVSSASQVLDFSAGNFFNGTIAVSGTMAAPTNAQPGQSGAIVVTQNATAKTLAFGPFWKWAGTSTGALSTGTGVIDSIKYLVLTSTSAETSISNNIG